MKHILIFTLIFLPAFSFSQSYEDKNAVENDTLGMRPKPEKMRRDPVFFEQMMTEENKQAEDLPKPEPKKTSLTEKNDSLTNEGNRITTNSDLKPDSIPWPAMGVTIGFPSLYFGFSLFGDFPNSKLGYMLEGRMNLAVNRYDETTYESLKQNPFNDEEGDLVYEELRIFLGLSVLFSEKSKGYMLFGLNVRTAYLEMTDETGILGHGDKEYWIPRSSEDETGLCVSFGYIHKVSQVVYLTGAIDFPFVINFGIALSLKWPSATP